jgi:MFS family permease
VSTFRALRSRNYRLFFAGQSISVIGTWMTRLATSWLVYRLTDSAFLLGLVAFCEQIPSLVLSPFAGVWVDRWNRHRTLVAAQTGMMLQSFSLAALTLTGTVNIHWIIVLSVIQGVLQAFETPARQAFVIQMVEDRADLSNAIALNSSIFNMGRLVGPAIAGAVITAVGEGWCYFIDGASYLAVIAGLLIMTLRPQEMRSVRREVLHELSEGWSYIVSHAAIKYILLMLALVAMVGMPFSTLLPIMAGRVLGGGAHTLGFLTAATGVGAFTCAVLLALRKSVIGLGKWLAIASAMLGGSLVIFGMSRMLWLSLIMMFGAGFGMMQQIVTSNTILQTIVADDKRGRVMSFYAVAVFGFTPIGSLLSGTLAARFGAPETMMLQGALCLMAAGWFWGRLPEVRKAIRPIYIEMGLIPDPAVVAEAEPS